MSVVRFTLSDSPFAGRTGRGVRIAVVDSGIAIGHPHVGDLAEGVSLALTVTDTVDRIGHGTAVAAAIREKAPGAELVPVKVFDTSLKTDAGTLADAIRWAADHQCRVVNLSLGTANAEHAAMLESAVGYAAERGVLVVAAFESDAIRWIPGSLAGAVGVAGSADIEREDLIVDELGQPESLRVCASVFPRPIPGVPRERNLSGISFAVANTSGFLARMLETVDGLASVAGVSAILLAPGTGQAGRNS